MNPPPALVLASGSPRRRALLDEAGLRFEIQRPDVPEEQSPGEAPEAFAQRLAQAKAAAVARRVGPDPPRWVLAADTIVVLGDQVFGKPNGPEHAVELLTRLIGRSHRVLTAVTLLDSAGGAPRHVLVESTVHMRDASRDDVVRYIATGESLDKAGAYALQGAGRRFVASVQGSPSNVIGLPLEETLALLKEAGIA